MTKKKSILAFALVFVFILPAMFLLTACGGNNNGEPKPVPKASHTVTFVVDGKEHSTAKVFEDDVIVFPEMEENDAKAFDGWYMNSDCSGQQYYGSSAIMGKSDITFYGKYINYLEAFTFSDSGDTITGTTNAGKMFRTMKVPSKNGETSITTVGADALRNLDNLRILEIGEGITTIKERAFRDNNNLVQVKIPASVTSISSEVFSYCRALVEVYDLRSEPLGVGSNGYPEVDVQKVHKRASEPSNLEIDENFAYYVNNNEKILVRYFGEDFGAITISKDCTAIRKNAFVWKYNLTGIKFENDSKLTKICSEAFFDCRRLVSFVVPKNVVNIETDAFVSCTALVEIYNLSELTINKGGSENGNIGLYAKDIHTSLNDKSKLLDENNCIYYVNDSEKILLVADKYALTVTIADDCTSIGIRAFGDCENLTNIKIPEGVTNIEKGAFRNCTALAWVVISKSVKVVEEEAFEIHYHGQELITYYLGTQTEWAQIEIAFFHNTAIERENNRYYYSETKPESGNFWRYVNGVPTIWT